jgi:hypothetical protein
MFTKIEYVGPWAESPDWNKDRQDNCEVLIARCAKLENMMLAAGVLFPVNPHTETQISGETYGGFRPQDCPIGAAHSSHKEGKAVDRYDPTGEIDAWLLENYEACVKTGNIDMSALAVCGIYIEHPDSTPGWSHWGIKLQDSDAPRSGHHIFYP